MKMRLLLLGLPLLLTGCAYLPDWFPFSSSAPELAVSESGLGGINASTELQANVLQPLLSDYRLRFGIGSKAGAFFAFYQALQEDKVLLVLSGSQGGTVEQIEVMDDSIPTAWGVTIGTPFSELYSKAFGVCRQGQEEEAGSIECVSPQSAHVHYVFTGEWRGPASLLPSDDVLKSWQVSRIIWRAGLE